jgi:vanillate O-demethylase ferredoxin subunit
MRHIRLALRAAEPAGPGIRLLTLMDPDGWPLPRWRPGAHIDLHLPNGLTRAYSLCGDPAEADRWRIAVKREPGGRGGSAWLHDALAVGEELPASLPRCTFPLAEGARRHLFLAGGIGVTPFLPMAAALARSGADHHLHLLHRGPPPLPAQLVALGDRITLHDTSGGRPDLGRLLGPSEPGTEAYCSGPPGLIEAFLAAWPSERARVEHFTPPPLPPLPDSRPFTLVLAKSGRRLDLPAGAPLLPALHALGAAVESSCEGGICGACRVRWVEGPPIHRDRILRPGERETHLMACVAGCAGPRLVLDL